MVRGGNRKRPEQDHRRSAMGTMGPSAWGTHDIASGVAAIPPTSAAGYAARCAARPRDGRGRGARRRRCRQLGPARRSGSAGALEPRTGSRLGRPSGPLVGTIRQRRRVPGRGRPRRPEPPGCRTRLRWSDGPPDLRRGLRAAAGHVLVARRGHDQDVRHRPRLVELPRVRQARRGSGHPGHPRARERRNPRPRHGAGPAVVDPGAGLRL